MILWKNVTVQKTLKVFFLVIDLKIEFKIINRNFYQLRETIGMIKILYFQKFLLSSITTLLCKETLCKNKSAVNWNIYILFHVNIFLFYIKRAHDKDVVALVTYMAAFWNGVDLKFREIKDPLVRLNIAGIVIITVKYFFNLSFLYR